MRPIQKLLRSSTFVQTQVKRGGHGWTRPDVPLQVLYKHRRVLSIYDVNMWFYCGVQPEYFINTNEGYLNNWLGGVKEMLIQLRWYAMICLAVLVGNEVMNSNKEQLVDPVVASGIAYSHYPQRFLDRPLTKIKHFTGIKSSPESGCMTYDPNYEHWIVRFLQDRMAEQNEVLKQTLETKNYIERVENEARAIVEKRRGTSHKEDTHHHH